MSQIASFYLLKDGQRQELFDGVASGTTETTFSPGTPCTRGQIATFLYRAAQAETSAK